MRNLIYAINITLDGCCDHTKGIPNDEILGYFADVMRNAGVIVYGRKTYELMVPFWPDVAKSNSGETAAMNEFAQAFDSVGQIVVFSRSMETAEGGKTRIVRTDLRDEILKLKQEPGKDISVGGVDLPSQLMKLGLIDEYHIVIHPVIAGRGRRLFDEVDLPEQLHLKLAESKVLKSGYVALRYLRW